MNYLLHHHVASKALASPVSGIGAMLPDLWRMIDRRARVRSKRRAPITVSGALARGVQHHLVADRWFHSSPDFLRALDDTAVLLRQTHLVAPKSRLLGHVMWELALDGALVEIEGPRRISDRLTEGMLACGQSELDRVTKELALGRISVPGERSRFLDDLKSLMSRLFRAPTIAELAEPQGLTARIRGVRRRLGLDDLPAPERDGARNVFAALLDIARQRIPALLELDWSSLLVQSSPAPRALR